MSETEREALEAGNIWWDGELFSGMPDWDKLMSFPAPELSEEEKAFIDGPCEELCSMLDDWDICHVRGDMPPDVWAFMKEHRFFAMIILKQYGGLESSAYANAMVIAKLASRNAAVSSTVGVPNSLGPSELLLHYGTEEQKLRHLPKIVSGEIRWCQGYSEPGAGSDLASLQTKCEDKGDHFVVNGQKIWTSGAQYADWIFTLVRTEPQAPKHEGISFVLIDMEQPGVTVKPIKLISGYSPFCETFFDDARCEKDNLVGQLNRGWTVGKRLLQHERSSISGLNSGGRRGGSILGRLPDIGKEYLGTVDGKMADPALRDDVIKSQMDSRCFGLTQRRAMAESETGGTPTFLTSMFKYYGSEVGNRRLEIQLELMGTQSLGWEGDTFTDFEKTLTRAWLRSKASTIAGGSSEIQLNIIAKRVLGLPD